MIEMKKVIVIGCPGSGKSTFSRALHNSTGLPLFHLDMMYWNVDKTTVDKSVFLERLSDVLSKNEWIIDGNYASTMELRLKACDMVIFFYYHIVLCLEGIRERRGKKRSDMPWIEIEEDEEFVEFVKSFNDTQRPYIFELLEKYKNSKQIVILKSREEADSFVALKMK